MFSHDAAQFSPFFLTDCNSAVNNQANVKPKKNSQTSDGNVDFSAVNGEVGTLGE